MKKANVPWAFPPSGVEHEVHPVTSGIHLTVAYDIFSTDISSDQALNTDISGDINVETCNYPSTRNFKPSSQTRDSYRKVANCHTLSHEYPMNSGRQFSYSLSLKGNGAILERVVDALGRNSSLKSVFEADSDDYPVVDRRYVDRSSRSH